jgi:hypothetical protein
MTLHRFRAAQLGRRLSQLHETQSERWWAWGESNGCTVSCIFRRIQCQNTADCSETTTIGGLRPVVTKVVDGRLFSAVVRASVCTLWETPLPFSEVFRPERSRPSARIHRTVRRLCELRDFGFLIASGSVQATTGKRAVRAQGR